MYLILTGYGSGLKQLCNKEEDPFSCEWAFRKATFQVRKLWDDGIVVKNPNATLCFGDSGAPLLNEQNVVGVLRNFADGDSKCEKGEEQHYVRFSKSIIRWINHHRFSGNNTKISKAGVIRRNWKPSALISSFVILIILLRCCCRSEPPQAPVPRYGAIDVL